MLTFLWHAALYTCAVFGAMTLTASALLIAFLAREMRRIRQQAEAERRARFDADLEAILREAAGGAR